jgi:hypothetical protein
VSVLKQKNDRLGWKCHVYKNTLYCIEGIEMRQLGCKVCRLLFLNRYSLFQHTAAIFILERKEGEIGK